MAITHAALRSLWWMAKNGTSFAFFNSAETGMGDVSLNSIPTVSPVYGRQPDGTFKVQITITEAPSDLDSFDLTFLEDTESEHRLLQMLRDGRPIYLQRLTYNCPPVNNRALWKTLEHFLIQPDTGTLGASPNRDGTDAAVEDTVAVKVSENVRLYRTSLSGLTTTEAEAIASVAGLKDESDCLAGYPGADEIIVFGADGGAAAANGLYSTNGGGTIAEYTTDTIPFVDVGRNLVSTEIGLISDTQFRVIYFGGTMAAKKVEWAYADFPIGNAVLTAASWTLVTTAASVATDAVEATLWDQEINRLYIGAEGEIYVNTDDGVSDPGTAVYTGANAWAEFAKDEDGNIWVVGAANDIRRELVNDRGTFAARVGPSGGGAFTAIAFADDGLLYAGNGTSIFKSNDKGESAGGWTSLKDFGANHSVIGIEVEGGASTTIKVVVDDTTPGVGSIWRSEDKGNSFRLITETANDGYNDVYFTKDPNRSIIVGDVVAALGVIELLSNP